MPLRQQSATVHILGVGNSFFGIEQGDSQTATVDHYDFGIANFNADAVRARLIGTQPEVRRQQFEGILQVL